ncbi:MAG TPA: FoF1 ATP synthase subunit gamma [Steroidobacteraceae bacterium]|nr:FoF1 ATP synthase subunit gamma [Steroidobacteraceae bacterium]
MRLAEIQVHIASMEELGQIIRALRSLASMRMRQAAHAIASVRQYSTAIATAIEDVLPLLAENPSRAAGARPGRRAVILCASEHGFVGDFNERLFEFAQAYLGAQDALFVLGTRGSALAAGRSWGVTWSGPMATRMASLPETVRHLVSELYGAIARNEVSSAHVISARYRHGAAPEIERRAIFPLDLARNSEVRARQPPLHNLAPGVLLEKLVAEYVFALLSEAAVESLASENVARFNAMDAAHENVSRRLEELGRTGQQARQEEVTTELLELVAGAQATA